MKILAAIIFGLLCGQAYAQTITPGPSGYQRLYSTGISVGNGADTTEDTLQTYTLSAGQLANVGDVIHIVAGGSLAATTDNKTIRIRVGNQIVAVASPAAAAITGWQADVEVIKTGANTQSYIGSIVTNSGASGVKSGTLTLTDSASIAVAVTGQNNTAASAGSVTSQILTVDYEH